MAKLPPGRWEGSDVTKDDLEWLLSTRRITSQVICRKPGKELAPVTEPGERVVFLAHFERGFGLPASDFFRAFLDFFGLQPHHLPANAFVSLSPLVPFARAISVSGRLSIYGQSIFTSASRLFQAPSRS